MAISPQRLTVYLYSAHRAVIFAIAQLSCHYRSCATAQNTATRLLLGLSRRDHAQLHIRPALKELHWLPVCTKSNSSWHWWCSQSTHTAWLKQP